MEKRKIDLEEIREHLDWAATKSISHSEAHTPGAGLIREAVFGFNDGLVTVLALAAGVSGAISENRIVILAAVAAAVAGTISMSLGAYISTKSQVEYYKSEVERERNPPRGLASLRYRHASAGGTARQRIGFIDKRPVQRTPGMRPPYSAGASSCGKTG